MKCTLGILFMVAAWATNAVAQGTVLWDESINGPLSNDGSNPTQLGVFQNGTNSILGATQYIPNAIYGDYFTFVVPNGNGVSRLVLSVDKPVAVWLGTPDFGSQYGYVINPANADLLPQWGLSSIGAGTFGMYIKDYDLSSGASTANYRLDFFVQTVPEPGAVCLFLVGAGVVGVLRWKKFPGIARTSAIQRPGVRHSGHQLSGSMIQPLVKENYASGY